MDLRHPAFQKLSLQHQEMMALATTLEEAAQYPAAYQLQATRPFIDAWTNHHLEHLEEEERAVLPRFVDDFVASRIRSGSKDLREQVEWLRFAMLEPGGPGPVLRLVAESLRHHVRLFEWEVFDGLQDHLKGAGMQRLQLEVEHFRAVREARKAGREPPPMPAALAAPLRPAQKPVAPTPAAPVADPAGPSA